MTNEERVKASRDQIARFFYSYFPQWRLVNIIGIKRLLESKFELFQDIIEPLKQADDPTGEATIAQEITNGYIFSALSECLQYVEDLFLLVKFGEKPDWFIKNIVTYQAGKITNFIGDFKTDATSIQRAFFVPDISNWKDANMDIMSAYDEGMLDLKEKVKTVLKFFHVNAFFYNQYKHGLTIALRPYSAFDTSLLEKKRFKPTMGYPVAFDNLSIDKVFKDQPRFNSIVMIACITPNTKPHLVALQQEDNLLRLVPHPLGEISIEYVVECARIVRSLIIIFRNNFINHINDVHTEFWLPKREKYLTFSTPV